MSNESFPCPACQETVTFPDDGSQIATCLKCMKTWKAGPRFQDAIRMAFGNGGSVQMILWHEQVDGLLASILVLLVPLVKVLLIIAAVYLLLSREDASPNWPALVAVFVAAYGLLEYIGRRFPVWFPAAFAATPTAIVGSAGVIYLVSQKPVMIPWPSVIEFGYFWHADPNYSHLDLTYKNVLGGSSTIILQEDSRRRLAELYDSLTSSTDAAGHGQDRSQ